VERRLVRRLGLDLRADVLKVGHHGSATSSTPVLLDAVAPRLALVSVGAGNRYRHPDAGVMAALQSRGTHVLRTDDDGTIVVTIDGSETLRVASGDTRWTLQRSSARPRRAGSG
jgi:competence protein ComEC